MQDLDDNALLREYAERGSEEAFSSLVARHINKVYSAALRHTGKPHRAEEITQAVFVILAKKARSLDRRVILSGWLYQTARLTAVTYIRGEIRRAHREQEAHMQTLANEKEPDVWRQIAPLLDEAMGELNETDRHAVVLRYFDGKSMREVGGALGATEDAAKKRVNRAVEKLEKFFLKRGIDSTAATLTEVISANSVQAAPAALAKSVAAVSLAKGVAASGSTLTLIRGALKTMAWAKMKSAVVVTAGVLLAASGGTAVYEALQPSRADADHSEASPPAMGGPADMRIKWEVGKKYSLRLEVNQQTETKIPNQPEPAKSGFDATENYDISPMSKLDNGGWQLELEFGNVAMNVQSGGHTVINLDSAQSSPGTENPAAAIVGARLDCFTDPGGEVERLEGKDQLMKRIAGDAKSRTESIFSELFTEDQLKMIASFGDMMPNRLVNVGEKWSRKKDIVTSIGTVTIEMNFTFKNWERHDDYNCAHIEETARLASKSVSTQSGAAIEVEKSKISADIWFAPALGMVVDVVNHRTQTLKVTTQAQTVEPEQTQSTRLMLLDVK